MKNRISINNSRIFLFVFLVLLIFSCKKTPTPITERLRPERAITIVNNTGSQIKGYEVSVANGPDITKGTLSGNSVYIKLDENLKNDREIEVVLVDVYDIIYAKTFTVALEGNTDTPIVAGDRKSEGAIKDAWKDFIKWLNSNK